MCRRRIDCSLMWSTQPICQGEADICDPQDTFRLFSVVDLLPTASPLLAETSMAGRLP